ncbi:hypothetical protein J3R83DRAFT_5411 [Lanmaoa asiatica]|nr:hypothetical protein J3R83DRAFT_5411 [Lanmaoa asiatica]
MQIKQYEELVWERKRLEVVSTTEQADPEELQHDDAVNRPKRERLKAMLAFGGQWLVVLYDPGQSSHPPFAHFQSVARCVLVLADGLSPEIDMVDQRLGLHLALNENHHVYKQTPEEGLIATFRAHAAAGGNYRTIEHLPLVTGILTKWHKLLVQDYVWQFIERTECLGLHLFDGKGDMKFICFHDIMLGTSGGVSPSLSLSLLALADVHYLPPPYTIFSPILTLPTGASPSTTTLAPSSRRLQPMSPDEQVALTSCIAKIKLLCFVHAELDSKRSHPHVPFMSCTIFAHMVSLLDPVKHALKEVASWWEPLIYMDKVHGKFWMPSLSTAALVRAIYGHVDIKEHKRKHAVRAIVYLVWTHYPSFLDLKVQLSTLNVPPRPTSQKSLLAMFGVDNSGKMLKATKDAFDALATPAVPVPPHALANPMPAPAPTVVLHASGSTEKRQQPDPISKVKKWKPVRKVIQASRSRCRRQGHRRK